MFKRLVMWWIEKLSADRHSYDNILLIYPPDTLGYAKLNLAVKIIDLKLSICRCFILEDDLHSF